MPTSPVFPATQNKTIGQRLCMIIDRFEEGNASAMARRTGYSQTGVGKIYRGETDWPSSQLLVSVINAYHIDPSWLLMGVPSVEWANSRGRTKRDALELAVRHAQQTLDRIATGYVEVEDSWG